MLQFKLFKVFNRNKAETMKELYSIFGKDKVFIFSENIFGISYDYGGRGYKYVLNRVRKLNISQFIISSNTYFKLISFCMAKNKFINNIEFVDSIHEEHNEFIKKQLNEINRSKIPEKKEALKNRLFDELQWITSDECIDIKRTKFSIKIDNPPINCNVDLYHNGVLFVDNKVILDEVKKIMEKILI